MGERLRDAEHILRLVALFAAGVTVFLIVRALLVPPGFGEYGHYRSGALADNWQRPPAFAGRAACADCHDEAATALAGDVHAPIGCESCHGPLAAHAADPGAVTPEIADVTRLCTDCHAAEPARPATHPQVEVAGHAEGAACADCHEPHAPEL
jgi:hypothetical protein